MFKKYFWNYVYTWLIVLLYIFAIWMDFGGHVVSDSANLMIQIFFTILGVGYGAWVTYVLKTDQ